jgi:hypothetical protein
MHHSPRIKKPEMIAFDEFFDNSCEKEKNFAENAYLCMRKVTMRKKIGIWYG